MTDITPADPQDTIVVEAGTRPGYVQIRFTNKPDAAVRDVLKERKFRWSSANKVWYGKIEALPPEYDIYITPTLRKTLAAGQAQAS